MPKSTSSEVETASIDFLESHIRKCEAKDEFDRVHWKSLKMQISATPATDLAGVAAKLRVVDQEIQIDADQLDLNILRSAITDLQLFSMTTSQSSVKKPD